MNSFLRFSYAVVGQYAEKQDKKDKDLHRNLLKADWGVRSAAFRAAIWTAAAIAALVGLLLAGVIALAAKNAPLIARIAPFVALPFFFGGLVVALAPLLLQNSANERGKDIDENLPHGLNYMLALANAGLPPREIWASLARATVFGALAVEAERIRRDLDLFGLDLLTALRQAQDRTPSRRFQEFLQGAISAFQSGVELESYLRQKGAQYQREAMEHQLRTIDTMGVMAEAFLVVVVAAPLFLIILLTVMSVNQGGMVLSLGYALVFLFMPLTQVVIGALVKSMNPRVWT